MHLSVIDTVCILPFRALKIMPILPVLKGCKPLQHFPPTANELKSADFEVQEEKKESSFMSFVHYIAALLKNVKFSVTLGKH